MTHYLHWEALRRLGCRPKLRWCDAMLCRLSGLLGRLSRKWPLLPETSVEPQRFVDPFISLVCQVHGILSNSCFHNQHTPSGKLCPLFSDERPIIVCCLLKFMYVTQDFHTNYLWEQYAMLYWPLKCDLEILFFVNHIVTCPHPHPKIILLLVIFVINIFSY